MASFDVIVIGGGAIGSTIAWRLGQTGRKVLLLERGQLGCEASSAAAGMLGAQLEVKQAGPFYQLCLESRSMYPSFASELLEETGIDIQYVANGILHLATSEIEAAMLRDRLKWQTSHGGTAEWMNASTVQELEPVLSSVHGALFLSDDGNVYAPHVARASGVAAKKRATVVEGADVKSIEPAPDHVTVRTGTDVFRANHVVVAAGAWADEVLQGAHTKFGIAPVKGQLCSIRSTDGRGLTKTIFSDDVYLVPKLGGSIVVGATEEHNAGFNRTVTIDALHTLMSAVRRIAPGLADAQFEKAWIGLRPNSSTGLPAIGPTSNHPRVHVAVGHFRNGILLAPITARMVVAGIDEQPYPALWEAFTPAHMINKKEVGAF